MDRTLIEGVVDHSHRLHERVDRRRADELPAELLELLRQRDRLQGGRQTALPGFRLWLELPDECRERAFLLHELACAPCIVDDRFYLAAMAHDAGVAQQSLHVACAEP